MGDNEACGRILKDFDVPYEAEVISAHRTPDRMFEYAETAIERGLKCIIAGAGGAAHLPGMIAAKTILPVLGVPVTSRQLQGVDSLLSIVQMPRGVPVATFAIGEAGASNAGLFAVALLAIEDVGLAKRLLQSFASSGSNGRGDGAAQIMSIMPGAMLGLLGGGQLGRMFTMAAQSMGYRVTVLDPADESPSSSIAERHLRADYLDGNALRELGSTCAGVTTEFENVPAEALRITC